MTQLARWGLITFPKNWVSIVDRVCRTDVYGAAARELGLLDIGRDAPIKLFDGKVFDPSEPIVYLSKHKIKHQPRIEEMAV